MIETISGSVEYSKQTLRCWRWRGGRRQISLKAGRLSAVARRL
ncbi:hypothetical protein IL54_2553 [Sphingobium sp. ba1]|nr:hypothetical protein IL54_2553 [Sphingobium sp. ba1]